MNVKTIGLLTALAGVTIIGCTNQNSKTANHLRDEQQARTEVRDSLDLSVKEFATIKGNKGNNIDYTSYWQLQRREIGRKKLIELCKTGKQYDSITNLISDGKTTYSTAVKNLKAKNALNALKMLK